MRREDCFDKYGRIIASKVFSPAFTRGLFLAGNECRYRVFKGARATGKSKNVIGYETVFKIVSDERREILIVRLNSNSNKQSTYEDICGCIYDLGMERSFRMKENPIPEITYKPTGQVILFRGMNDPTTLNSITTAKGNITDVYVEEAFELESYADFRKLDGSLRISPLPLQITLCFNAWSKGSWIYEKFFKGIMEDDIKYLDRPDVSFQDYCDPEWVGDFGKGLYLHTSTYKANPFRSPDWDRAAEMTKERSMDTYIVEFLGGWGNSTAATYPEFKDENILTMAEIRQRFRFADFTLGVDTGFSNGEGGKRTVGRNQAVEERVKSATVLTLCAVSDDYNDIVLLDEYYHTEIERNGSYNTDEPGRIGEPMLLKRVAEYTLKWMSEFGAMNIGVFNGQLVRIFVDSADVGFTDMLQEEFKRRGYWNIEVFPSGKKLSVQARTDFEKIMLAWGNMFVSDRCKNTIREFKNARRDSKGRAREDNDDHCLTSFEYAFSPLLPDVKMWKKFKQH